MSDLPPASQHTFQVDLRGIVDLLSHHLYSSPQVYVRELLQNAVDAVALRLDDRGALDCVLRARLKAALLRATDEPVDWGKVL